MVISRTTLSNVIVGHVSVEWASFTFQRVSKPPVTYYPLLLRKGVVEKLLGAATSVETGPLLSVSTHKRPVLHYIPVFHLKTSYS